MAYTTQINPTGAEIPRKLTQGDLQQLWNNWISQFPQGFKGQSVDAVMNKIAQVFLSHPQIFIILLVIKNLTGIVHDIAATAHYISGFIESPNECLCDALECLTQQYNESNFPRQAEFQFRKEFLEALLKISNNALLAGHLNRQGFALDDFSAGQDELSYAQHFIRELTDTAADAKLGCGVTQDIGDE